jgi:16S rRNA (guanine1207-N2)-methyltransferase
MQSSAINDYAQFRNVSATIGARDITFVTKPGIEDWDQVKPLEHLAANLVHILPGANVVILGSRHGALPAAFTFSNPSAMFTCLESNWITIQSIHQTSVYNTIDNLKIHQYPIDPPLATESFDIAVMLIPKGRNLARRWLLETIRVLKPYGVLYLGGANDIGVQSIIKDAAELFTYVEILGYKKGTRIAKISKKKRTADFPAWAGINGIAPGTWQEFEHTIGANHYSVRCLPGVFSADHLDEGTSLLLDNFEVPENARVLDVGCGYGILGMAAARKQASAQIEMVDVDLMAVASSAENIRLNLLANVRVFASDLLSACSPGLYQLILSNPPFHTGKQTNYMISEALVEQAYNCLAPGGELILVANRFLRYEKLMEPLFSRVTIKVQTNKFHVITGVR